MTAVIVSLITANWQALATLGAMVAAALGFYAKGRSDVKNKIRMEDSVRADKIRKDGAEARDGAAADVAAGRLRDDDGWRRS